MYVKIDFYNVVLSFKGTKIFEFNQYQKSDEVPFISYADPETFL